MSTVFAPPLLLNAGVRGDGRGVYIYKLCCNVGANVKKARFSVFQSLYAAAFCGFGIIPPLFLDFKLRVYLAQSELKVP